jgi:hypothetical protein
MQLSPGPRFASVEPKVLKKWEDLQIFAPNVVVGSASELHRMAEQSNAGYLDTSSIDHALVVITHFGCKPLSDMRRVLLWQSFGVPIFELYVALDNSLLGSECEAHEGWHLAPGVGYSFLGNGELILDGVGNNGLIIGFAAAIDSQPCPCGRVSAKLIQLDPSTPRFENRFLAVSA